MKIPGGHAGNSLNRSIEVEDQLMLKNDWC
jgi:hypothetical protein